MSEPARERSDDRRERGDKGRDDKGRDEKSSSSRRKRRRSRSPEIDDAAMLLTKEQRTVYVSQLTQKSSAHDLKKYFKRKAGPVSSIYFLIDKRTGRHKGAAYVEMQRLDDVPYAVNCNGRVPEFQRFPILVRPSESEKNLAAMIDKKNGGDGKLDDKKNEPNLDPYRIHIGNIPPGVSPDQLKAIFSFIGNVLSVTLQPPAGSSGNCFGFVSFGHASEAALGMQAMKDEYVAGSQLSTGWSKASQEKGTVDSQTAPPPSDAKGRILRSREYAASITVLGGGAVAMVAQPVAQTAEEAQDAEGEHSKLLYQHNLVQKQNAQNAIAAGLASLAALPKCNSVTTSSSSNSNSGGSSEIRRPDLADEESGVSLKTKGSDAHAKRTELMAKLAARGGAAVEKKAVEEEEVVEKVVAATPRFIVHNCFDKDEETDDNWWLEIKEDMHDEGGKFGNVKEVDVKHLEAGGKVVIEYETVQMAEAAVAVFHDRWFGERQLKCEYL